MQSTQKIIGAIVLLFVVVSIVVTIIFLRNGTELPLVEDFEQNTGETNFGAWTANKDVPPDPNSPGSSVQWHIRRSSNVSRSGSYSAVFFIDGRQDDGTIWLERKVTLKQGTQTRLEVSFWFYSEHESFNAIAAVVAYVGTSQPTVEENFSVISVANEIAGWKNYHYTAIVTPSSNGEAYAAVGISVRWETYMTYYIDDIVIS